MSSHENTRIAEVSQEDAAGRFVRRACSRFSALPKDADSDMEGNVQRRLGLGHRDAVHLVAVQGEDYRGHVLLNLSARATPRFCG